MGISIENHSIRPNILAMARTARGEMIMPIAKFAPGQIVHHLVFNYRGVVADIDPEFNGSDEWYEKVAKSRPPKDQPWYHVLVDGADHLTYVAERHLEIDASDQPIQHPAINHFFESFAEGHYHRSMH
tara:strand:+ start:256 stop:639 length:384 start_codon:yes stop_codon:yes gene_type:complete